MPLLDQMAAAGRLSWYIDNLIDAHIEEENDEALWDVWLHKVWEAKSFDDFKRETTHKARTQAKNEYIRNHPKETAKTVMKSRAIIDMFNKPVEQK